MKLVNSNGYYDEYNADIKIWGKSLEVVFLRSKTDKNDTQIYILNDLKDECPKCGTGYDTPQHQQTIICSCCSASYYFLGANHPRPIERTKMEILKATNLEGGLIDEWL